MGEKQFEGIQIYDAIQDYNLNYWFATDQGIYKYNHYKFEKINSKNLKEQSAFGFVINANGTIFCYNLNNQILKIENDTCKVLYELKDNEKSNDIHLIISPENNLLILTKIPILINDKGKKINTNKTSICYYGFPFITKNGTVISHLKDKDSLLILKNNLYKTIKLQGNVQIVNGVLKFFSLNKKTYAISSKDKFLYSFDEETSALSLINNSGLIKNDEFLRFYDLNNQLWLASTISGVQILNEELELKLSENIFTKYLISDIYKDKENNILLSTFNHGIIVIPNSNILDAINLPENPQVVSINIDKELGILMGTLHGELIAYKNNNYTVISKNGNRPLQSVFTWSNFKNILFDDGKIKFYNKVLKTTKVISESSLKDALKLNDGSILMAVNTGVYQIYIENEKNISIKTITEFKNRTNVIEKESTSEFVYAATSNGVKYFENINSISDFKYNNEIVYANDITKDENNLYISTNKKEILKIKNGKVIKTIIPIVNNNRIEIRKFKIKNNHFYTLSNFGFIIFDSIGKPMVQLNKTYGFSTNKIFDFDLLNDEIWISHSKGVQKILEKNINRKVDTPLIKITEIKVNDSLINKILNNHFSTNKRKFKFTLSSPTLINKENVRYFYKLSGYEKTWQIATYDQNEIIYNALAPGEYSFIVKSENQGVYSQPIYYSFIIESPFYTKWWFIIICIVSFLAIVFLIYRWQININKKKSQQIIELNLSKLTAIQSQMNPHFIFNSLNSIQDLILKGDVENSYSYITTFSNLVRRTLNNSDKDFIDFDQEIKLIEIYLSLEKLRFKKELNYTINTNNIEDIMVPPLLIQPFIENALIHGLLHKEGEKRLQITFELKENLICIVEDNGIGREKSKAIKLRQRSDHESFSGKAIHKRFEILSNIFKGNFGYEYTDLYNKNEASGTKVILIIPIKHKF